MVLFTSLSKSSIHQYPSTSIGVKNNNDMNLNSLSGSSTIAGDNLGINIGSLAQKIINDVKNKLERQGINIH